MNSSDDGFIERKGPLVAKNEDESSPARTSSSTNDVREGTMASLEAHAEHDGVAAATTTFEDVQTDGTAAASFDTVKQFWEEGAVTADSTAASAVATATAADFTVTVHDDSIVVASSASQEDHSLPKEKLDDETVDEQQQQQQEVSPLEGAQQALQQQKRRRKHKRARVVVRNASIEKSNIQQGESLSLASNQYECILYRRALRNQNQQRKDKSEDKEEVGVYGDVSLGMKLTVIGGKVIVQNLNALSDGRASPAQLAGVIQKGDVLLSINNVCLKNVPSNQMMRGLSPLSTPDANGLYQRELKLRFAAGEGLGLLEKMMMTTGELSSGLAADKKGPREPLDGANEVFNLFPMVDQLSGMPFFEQENNILMSNTTGLVAANEENERPLEEPSESVESLPKKILLDDAICDDIAKHRIQEKEQFVSEYFAWSSQEFSDLLRPPVGVDLTVTAAAAAAEDSTAAIVLTLSELIERGRNAIKGAEALSKRLEKIDRGSDVRSWKSLATSLSRCSRASTRRRLVFQAEEPIDEEKDESFISEATSEAEEEELPADEKLLYDAAHDEIWRHQLVEYLEKLAHQGSGEGEDERDDEEQPAAADIDSALSNELGSFLFGENMSKILKRHKKPQVLPPEEITTILFELSTKIYSTVPDEITAAGSHVTSRSVLMPFSGTRRPAPGSDVFLANQFLLTLALPAWLKTFRPLPWEQRRILWPLDKPTYGGSTTGSTLDDDSLTLESMSTNQYSPSLRHRSRRKNLRERIEEQELNFETKRETCFLVTYYFIQRLLLRLFRRQVSFGDDGEGNVHEKTSEFIKEYGSYLKMDTCLVYSAILKADGVIRLLLAVAQFDPRHMEAMKEISKANVLAFYEPTMLSAVVQKLHDVRTELRPDRRLATIDLCASAYPDVQPWQVQLKCCGTKLTGGDEWSSDTLDKEMDDLYYVYLSLLLHPTDGYEKARHDPALVKEWCELSVRQVDGGVFPDRTTNRLKNFYRVASRTSSDHLAYTRALVLLLTLSLEINEHDLALDLSGEILEDPRYSQDVATVDLVLNTLRTIGIDALDSEEQHRTSSARKLKRILRIYRKASRNSTPVMTALNVPAELFHWIEHRSVASADPQKTLKLIRFLANEALPRDILQVLRLWAETSDSELKLEILPVLQTVLRRAANQSLSSELSGTLLRLRHARLRLNPDDAEKTESLEDDELPGNSIWKRMSNGMVTVVK